jgi:hypothetical protein
MGLGANLFPSPQPLTFFMDNAALLDQALIFIRHHIRLSALITVAVYLIVSWVNSSKKWVTSSAIVLSQARIPRVFIVDSNWFDRSIDILRTFVRAKELTQKGYDMVNLIEVTI